MKNNKITDLRGERKQKEYAAFLDIDLRTVQNWESRGAGKTTLKLLEKIKELECTIDHLQECLKDENKIFYLPKE